MMSERKFYQKITDIYATAIDYDVNATVTSRFFSTVQNKPHWTIHGHTAAEVIYNRQMQKVNLRNIKLFRNDCSRVILISFWKIKERIDLIDRDFLTVQVNG